MVLACGATGSGKTLWVKEQIATARAVLIWDAKWEYRGFRSAATIPELVAAIKKGPQRIAYTPTRMGDFGAWCKTAHAAAALWGGLAVVVEELADVTSPGKAPEDWGIIIRRGRARGMRLYATSQRPSESDKTIMGNLTLLHVGRMPRLQDARYIQSEIGVTADEIQRLPDRHYVECDARGTLSRGIVAIPRKRKSSARVT